MGNFSHNKKKFYKWNMREYRELFFTAVVAGFVLSFRKWGDGSVMDVALGTTNLIIGIIFAFACLYVHVAAQKLAAIKLGAVAEYGFWKLGLFFGAVITFISNGFLPLFFTGTLFAKGVPILRTGKYPPRFKVWEFGLLSFAGPFVNLLLVFLAKPLFIWTGWEIVMYFIFTNLLIMIWSMIPLPLFHGVRVIEGGRTAYDFKGGTVGFNVFIANRWVYVFFFSLIIVYSLLVMLATMFSLLISILVALLVTVVFYMQVENS